MERSAGCLSLSWLNNILQMFKCVNCGAAYFSGLLSVVVCAKWEDILLFSGRSYCFMFLVLNFVHFAPYVRFRSGNFFLIAPFPDHSLLLPLLSF